MGLNTHVGVKYPSSRSEMGNFDVSILSGIVAQRAGNMAWSNQQFYQLRPRNLKFILMWYCVSAHESFYGGMNEDIKR